MKALLYLQLFLLRYTLGIVISIYAYELGMTHLDGFVMLQCKMVIIMIRFSTHTKVVFNLFVEKNKCLDMMVAL